MNQLKFFVCSCVMLSSVVTLPVYAAPPLQVSQHVWLEFSVSEKVTLLAKFPQIETIPSETLGIIQSVQAVNRSTAATNSGAALGGALGQALYIDNAFRGNSTNYSATAQLGVALLGAVVGSSLDSAAQSRFIFNYGVKTLDGELREVRVEAVDEFTRPVGQCVFLPSISPAPVSLCIADKVQFLKKLSALAQAQAPAPASAVISQESTVANINCRVPGVGLMRLEKNVCIQMDGAVEQ
jgi:outer membrane lipoprotein SlyB